MENFPFVQAGLALACFIGAIFSLRSLMLWRVLLGILLIIVGACMTLKLVPDFTTTETTVTPAMIVSAQFSDLQVRKAAIRDLHQNFQGRSFNAEEVRFTEVDLVDAKHFVEALCDGDLHRLQKVVDRFEGRPVELSRVCNLVNQSLLKANAGYQVWFSYEKLVHVMEQERRNGFDGMLLCVGAAPVPMQSHKHGTNYHSWPDDGTDVQALARDIANRISTNLAGQS